MCSAGVPEVKLLPMEDTQADLDLSLEEQILQAEEDEAHDQQDADNSLLSGWGGASRRRAPVHIPSKDAVDSKLQQVSAKAAGAAKNDSDLLRLALIKCNEHDEGGIVEFCENMQQVHDVTAGRIGRNLSAMKLIAGQRPDVVIQTYSFDEAR